MNNRTAEVESDIAFMSKDLNKDQCANILSRKVKSRRSRVIISNDQPFEGLVSQLIKEFIEFNRKYIVVNRSALKPFRLRLTSTSKNELRKISQFIKNRILVEAAVIIEDDNYCSVVGYAIAKAKTTIRNSFESSKCGGVTILNMYFLNTTTTGQVQYIH